MDSKKLKVLLFLASSLLCLGVVAYLFNKNFSNLVEEATPTGQPTKEIKASLIIIVGAKETSISARVEEGDTLLDLMERLRKDGKISYEITSYTYGDVVETINGKTGSWTLLVNDSPALFEIKTIKVTNKAVYKWIYESR